MIWWLMRNDSSESWIVMRGSLCFTVCGLFCLSMLSAAFSSEFLLLQFVEPNKQHADRNPLIRKCIIIQCVLYSRVCFEILRVELKMLIDSTLHMLLLERKDKIKIMIYSCHSRAVRLTVFCGMQYLWPWSTKPVLSRTGIFVAIAKNT